MSNGKSGAASGILVLVTLAALVTAGVVYWKQSSAKPTGKPMAVEELPKKVRMTRMGKEHLSYKDGYIYIVEADDKQCYCVTSKNALPDWFLIVDGMVLDAPPPQAR